MLGAAPPPCDTAAIRGHRVSRGARMHGAWVLTATILGSSLVFIDGTVANVALPALQSEFDATASQLQWVIEAYALFLAALLLVGGSLADRYGRRRVFLAGVVIFALASACCGLASSMFALIVARAMQGVGAALLAPSSLAIIGACFADDARGRAIGTWSGFTGITAAIGPALGGWLIDNASWRWAFFINLPLALVVIVIGLRFVPETRNADAGRQDWLGAALATLGLTGLVYGLMEVQNAGFRDVRVLSAIGAGALALALFVLTERRIAMPMVPMRLFRVREFAGANLLTLLLYAALGGGLYFLPLNLIQVQGYSATAAGAALLPFILMMFLLSRWAGGLVPRYGARLPLTVGPMVASFGYLLFAVPAIGNNYWTTFFPAALVLGLGMAISIAPLTTTVMSAVGEELSGLAAGINNAVSRTATLLAIALLGLLMAQQFNASFEPRLAALQLAPENTQALRAQASKLAGIQIPAALDGDQRRRADWTIQTAYVAGFRAVMYVCAGLALLAALPGWTMIRGQTASQGPRQQVAGHVASP